MATPTKRKAHKSKWRRKGAKWVRHTYNSQGTKTLTEERTTPPGTRVSDIRSRKRQQQAALGKTVARERLHRGEDIGNRKGKRSRTTTRQKAAAAAKKASRKVTAKRKR